MIPASFTSAQVTNDPTQILSLAKIIIAVSYDVDVEGSTNMQQQLHE